MSQFSIVGGHRPPLQRFDFLDLSEKNTQPLDLSIRAVLYVDESGSGKPLPAFTLGPEPHHGESNTGSTPRQFSSVDQTPSFVIARRAVRLAPHVVQQPDLRPR